MRIVKSKTHHSLVVTLGRHESRIWAGTQCPDARTLDDVRRRVRAAVRAEMARRGIPRAEIYGGARDGGCCLEAVEL